MTGRDNANSQAEIYLTAADAYPSLERQFLTAQSHIAAGFRVFDPRTKLRSDAARAVGDDWYDLICHTLARGVKFRLILTDFDPVVRPASHRMTWSAVRRLISAAEASGRPELLDLTAAMQPARIGHGAAVALWPKVMREISKEAKRLNGLSADRATRQLTLMPLLAPYVAGQHPNFRPNYRTLPRLVPTTHHQKVAVFDSKTVYIGGLDLDERRYDTPEHDRPGKDTWRDCQILTTGPLVQEVETHLARLLGVTAGKLTPSPTRHLLQTLSAPQNDKAFSLSPKPVVTTIEQAHLDHVRAAKDLIYLETQFFRSLPLAKAMAAVAKANPTLQALIILPAAPEDVAFEGSTSSDAHYGEYLQAKCLDLLSDAFGQRLFVAAPAQMRKEVSDDRSVLASAPLIYVHAKVSIFDEQAAIVSSANLNGRSLRWDTEVGTTLTDQRDVVRLRDKCLAHWLPDGEALTSKNAVAAARVLAKRNAKKPPQDRDGFLLPFPIAPARRFGRNLPGVPEEMT